MSLERKFQKQLQEARRANDVTVDNLRKSYANEIETLKMEKQKLELRLKEAQSQVMDREA
eukprot:CAMPEP_0201283402 /NCGR_PEP_ID=MMETSP1317-20130820/8459_1 /ASSEMBLY_ACC=CAM_ASM_000770 /TAXON_ID=187299 /ORGANISM="Undescribed Undescribed, Strain Undescribed" /LENGTH=59 /DNA_ID=CAMNT_0047599525 /DNA_START=250 /DNA_END=429 /DNA_ORIENTATION=+